MKKAKLIKRTQLTENVIDLEFKAEETFEFKPGQYISMRIADVDKSAYFRAYSIASVPNGNKFNLCVKILERSRGSNWINTLNEGNEIEYLGPLGELTFSANSDKKAFFIATGTGIAPFKSIIETQLKKGFKNKMHLLFGIRHIKGIFYKKFFEKLAQEYPNFTYEITLSQPESEKWDGSKGRVTEILKNSKIDVKNTEFYLCGMSSMIDEVTKILSKKGVKEGDMHFEKYD